MSKFYVESKDNSLQTGFVEIQNDINSDEVGNTNNVIQSENEGESESAVENESAVKLIQDESPYELLQNFENNDIDKTFSLSNVKRCRHSGDFGTSGFDPRASLIGFKEGVPGIFSRYKLDKLRRRSTPVLSYETSSHSPSRPPRRLHKQKSACNLVRIYDQVDGSDDPLKSDSENQSTKMDEQRIIIKSDFVDSGGVEDGIRYFNPGAESAGRPASTVVLLTSRDEDMSDSESWGSDFDNVSENVENGNECDDYEIYEVLGEPKEKTYNANYEDIDQLIDHKVPKPPLPPRRSIILETAFENVLDEQMYIPVAMEDEQKPVFLPPLPHDAEEYQVKRYQIMKCIIENEKIYMRSLERLIKEYEEPLLDQKLITNERCKVIFMHIHEILQCHQLFNMALSDRTFEWLKKDVIGDVLYASFSRAMVLKAYSAFVSNFNAAIDSIKETCKLVPAFLKFLKVSAEGFSDQMSVFYNTLKNDKKFKLPTLHNTKVNRLYRNNTKQSLYDLLRQPIERIPQLVVLIQALAKVTPLNHPDRPPLQMALTQLECLSETLSEKRKDSMCKHKVLQLDGYCTGLDKPLFSRKRYYVRHDDMLLCLVEGSKVVKTKLRRLFILNDLIICATILNKQKQLKLMTKKKYKVKWCIPINDVEVVDVGSGISVNINNKTTTIKYSHPISSPRPGIKETSKLLEDLQHDIAIIGDIAGKVASLRRSYPFLDTMKVKSWYKEVKQLLARETELANMHWIELSIPVKGIKDERMQCLFNVQSPQKKQEWIAEFNTVKLRLHEYNNPGWYLQEESLYNGETAVLRRKSPLVEIMAPLFIIEPKYSVQCVLEISSNSSSVLWIFSGNEHIGLITLMQMDMLSIPHVVESFIACQSRICCAEIVNGESPSLEDSNVSIWIGTMAGRILLFNPNAADKTAYADTILKDSIVSIKSAVGKVFVGLANGIIGCFRRKIDGSWDLKHPTMVCIGERSIYSLAVADQLLWCACATDIHIIDTSTLHIEKVLETSDEKKMDVKHLLAYGIGVWVSQWKSPTLQLYHAETFQHLQTVTTSTSISRMKNDIDGRIQGINIDKIYVTSLLASDGLLWVGLNQGLVVTYPLPRLGGIPTVSGQACVSFHAHQGPVKHLISFKGKIVDCVDAGKPLAESLQQDTLRTSVSDTSTSYMDEQKQSMEPVYFVVEPENREGDKGNDDENQVTVTDQIKSEVIGSHVDDKDFVGLNENIDEISVPVTSSTPTRDRQIAFVNEYSDEVASVDSLSDGLTASQCEEVVAENCEEGNEKGEIVSEETVNTTSGQSTEIKNMKNENEKAFNEENAATTPSKEISEISALSHSHAIQQLVYSSSEHEKDDETTDSNTTAESKRFISNETVDGVKEANVDQGADSVEEKELVGKHEETHESELKGDRKNESCVEDNSVFISQSDSGYELPITTEDVVVTKSYASVDKNRSPKAGDHIENHYRSLPLPACPCNTSPNAGPKNASNTKETISTPIGSYSERSFYTPLVNEDNVSASLSSSFDFKAYDKEMSLDNKSLVRDTNESYYAPLVAVSKQEIDFHRENLLKPSYVVSVGVGHVDLRKNEKQSIGRDLIRSFSGSSPEHLIVVWRL